MKSDIQIAQEANMIPINEVCRNFDIDNDYIENYGKYKAKFSEEIFDAVKNNKDGKLVLVTAVNPTPAGEGKTTMTIGLAQGLNKIGIKTAAALREPSLGPCMGIKGGAAGGGYSQVVPMEDINLHFTGDIHAMTTANNLLCAMIDNHIQHGNSLNIDTRNIVFKRAMDMNDRALRNIVTGLGGKMNSTPREDSFIITVASEIMAIVCLCENLADLKERLGKIIVAYDVNSKPVTAKDLKADKAMAVLLKDAIKPNIVQTLENTPAIIHGGPFANIAHGCSSVRATRLALKLFDVVITEAGFGADLGAEKFFDIKCRKAGLKPDAVVLVATVRALKYNGGADKNELSKENIDALKLGISNLEKHIENLQKFKVPTVVALNSFLTDTEDEINFVKERCIKLGADFSISEAWEKGGDGAVDLSKRLIDVFENKKASFKPLYDDILPIKEKIKKVCTEIYGAKDVNYSKKAEREIIKLESLGYSNLPVCIAKTQYSLSDNPLVLGRPEGFDINVKEVNLMAGFIAIKTGDIMLMPGLPKNPAAENVDVDESGKITGLF